MFAKNKKLKTVSLLVIIFGLPFCSAWYLYFHAERNMFGTTNHGELITKPFPLERLNIQQYSGALVHNKQHVWRIFFEAPSCDKICLKVLDKLLRVRVALGKDKLRTQAWLATEQKINQDERHKIEDPHGLDTKTFIIDSNHHPRKQIVECKQELLLIDPNGNVMMRYPIATSAKSIHSDLKKLLKLSQIG